jgi:hypothetical protein
MRQHLGMRKLVLGLVALLAMGDSCNNGVVGVQDYGSVTGRVLDATTNRPIAAAIISVGSLYTASADGYGAFTLDHIPVGLQTVTARMPGFTTVSTQIRIKKDATSSLGYLRIVPITKPDSVPTLPPPPTPTPAPTIVPTWVPSDQPSASPSATSAAVPSAGPSGTPPPPAPASSTTPAPTST